MLYTLQNILLLNENGSIILQNMNSGIKSSCGALLKECENNIAYKVPALPKDNFALTQLKKKLSHPNLNLSSPQEEEYNLKIIDKMRKNYIKKNQEKSIKKTDLGADLLTFTKQQYERLQLVDDCLKKGIIFRQTTEDSENEADSKLTAVDRLKKLAKMDDIREQIKTNYSWGQFAEKPKKSYLKIKNHPKFMKRTQKYKNYQILYELNGQKMDQKSFISKKYSLNKYFTNLLHKNSVAKTFLNSNPNWGITTNGFLSFAEKIEIIKDEATQYLKRLCANKNIYMTQERKNAIYECQILRLSKKVLSEKEYENLNFTLNEKENMQENVQEENKNKSNVQDQDKNCHAEYILEKNYKRIKLQRKRIIQKLY